MSLRSATVVTAVADGGRDAVVVDDATVVAGATVAAVRVGGTGELERQRVLGRGLSADG